jgi:uncharacterized protein YunC (DUF1805 family)
MLKVRLNLRKVVAIAIYLAGFSFSALAQNVVIQTNEVSKSATNDDCAYRINGICTTEDLGGVEISKVTGTADNCGSSYYKLSFENYNDFVVSVIYEYSNSTEENFKRTGTIILKAHEKKVTECLHRPESIKSIARKLKN